MAPEKILILLCAGSVVYVSFMLVSKSLLGKASFKGKRKSLFIAPDVTALWFLLLFICRNHSLRDPSFCLSPIPGNALLCQESVGYVCFKKLSDVY